jgi:hypothetical protein
LLLTTKVVGIDRVLSGWRIYPGARTHSGQQKKIWDGYWKMIDENAELKLASPRIRRLARASRHIFAMRFHPTGNRWAVRMHLLLGLLQHPTYWRYQKVQDLVQFTPGYWRVRRAFDLIRQWAARSGRWA